MTRDPTHAAHAGGSRPSGTSGDPADALSLEEVQRWMLHVVRHPEGVEAAARALQGGPVEQQSPSRQADRPEPLRPANIEDVIRPSRTLSAARRLQIYADAYHGRLLECLREEFPATFHAMGEDAFYGLALAYLQRYPSRSYTLAQLGARLPQFLRESRPLRESAEPDWADFLIELATLERTYAEVFDGPGMEAHRGIEPERIRSLTPECLLAARIRLAPCVRLLKLAFPVHEYATSVRRRLSASAAVASSAEAAGERLPAEGGPPAGTTLSFEPIAVPSARPTWLLVTRRQFVVRRWEISAAQFALLDALARGRPVGEAIAAAVDAWGGSSGEQGGPPGSEPPVDGGSEVTDRSQDVIENAVADWFAEWTRLKVIADIEVTALREGL